MNEVGKNTDSGAGKPRQAASGTGRFGERRRVTRETDVYVSLALDATPEQVGTSAIATGVPFLNHMLDSMARHAHFRLEVAATGDVEIDDHHTVEDVGLTLGQAFLEALGERRGIARFGYAYAPLDEALARVVIDISGRPFLVYEDGPVALADRVGTFDTSLAEEFWRAFTVEARVSMHLDLLRGRNSHHALEALFKAAGLALRAATRVEAGNSNVPSTKGVLG